MIAAAVIAIVVVYSKSPEAVSKGLNATMSLILEITPRMIAAFILAGLFQAIVPQEVIVRWMGHGSGMKGILIGVSLITPGGPMTHFPVIASLFKMGFGTGHWWTILPLGRSLAYNALSCGWAAGGGDQDRCEHSLPLRRLALRSDLGQTARLSKHEPPRLLTDNGRCRPCRARAIGHFRLRHCLDQNRHWNGIVALLRRRGCHT